MGVLCLEFAKSVHCSKSDLARLFQFQLHGDQIRDQRPGFLSVSLIFFRVLLYQASLAIMSGCLTEDLANQILLCEPYQKKIKELGLSAGTFLAVEAGEWLQGHDAV